MILTFCCAWLETHAKVSLEFFYWLNMKLYTVTKKMSAKLASETIFYMDFKPLTFGPFLKKTLYINIYALILLYALQHYKHLTNTQYKFWAIWARETFEECK